MSVKDPEIFRCGECDKAFLENLSMQRHERRAHGDENPSPTLTDSDVREMVDSCLVRTNTYASRPMIHAHDDDDKPLCYSVIRTAKWVKKDLSTIPPGYSEWCTNCLRELDA